MRRSLSRIGNASFRRSGDWSWGNRRGVSEGIMIGRTERTPEGEAAVVADVGAPVVEIDSWVLQPEDQ